MNIDSATRFADHFQRRDRLKRRTGRLDEMAGIQAGDIAKVNIWPRVGSVLTVAVVGIAMVLSRTGLPFSDEDWLIEARSGHQEWVSTSRLVDGKILDTRRYLTGLRRLGPPPHLPDLSANKLRIQRVTWRPPASGRLGALHAAYVSDGKCRISLWITKAEDASTGPLVDHEYGVAAYSWRTGGLQYVMVGPNMHEDRLNFIASVSRDLAIVRQGPSDTLQAAMGLSEVMSKPCKG